MGSDHIVGLNEIADPEAFLKGARIPLRTNTENRIEVVGDAAIIVLANGICGLQALNDLHGVVWSLDCSDPDVARWVDRKIAEVIVARMSRPPAPILSAALGIIRRAWVVTTMHDDGNVYPWGFYREESLTLQSIDAVRANTVLARTALLRHLFGVKK